jgi:hypothetical protein
MASTITKRCTVCRKFRRYDPDDRYCIECGHEGLESACECGRAFDYDIPESGNVHCPRCGKPLRGKSPEYDA